MGYLVFVAATGCTDSQRGVILSYNYLLSLTAATSSRVHAVG
jgi:hypothetical protein